MATFDELEQALALSLVDVEDVEIREAIKLVEAFKVADDADATEIREAIELVEAFKVAERTDAKVVVATNVNHHRVTPTNSRPFPIQGGRVRHALPTKLSSEEVRQIVEEHGPLHDGYYGYC